MSILDEWSHKWSKIIQVGISVRMAVGRINWVDTLTGFSHKKMYGRFAGTNQNDRNIEVTIRRGSTVLKQI